MSQGDVDESIVFCFDEQMEPDSPSSDDMPFVSEPNLIHTKPIQQQVQRNPLATISNSTMHNRGNLDIPTDVKAFTVKCPSPMKLAIAARQNRSRAPPKLSDMRIKKSSQSTLESKSSSSSSISTSSPSNLEEPNAILSTTATGQTGAWQSKGQKTPVTARKRGSKTPTRKTPGKTAVLSASMPHLLSKQESVLSLANLASSPTLSRPNFRKNLFSNMKLAIESRSTSEPTASDREQELATHASTEEPSSASGPTSTTSANSLDASVGYIEVDEYTASPKPQLHASASFGRGGHYDAQPVSSGRLCLAYLTYTF